MTEHLAFTGERYIPDVKGEIRLEHMHRYALAQGVVEGKKVLDIACGEGYGSSLLADHAEYVVGVDISQIAIDHATEKYSRNNLIFKQGSATHINFPDQSFDVVISFETIEHLSEQSLMLTEIKRVLKPDGYLLISSPNRPIYSNQSGKINEYHVKELDFAEFDQLLREHFEKIKYYGQRLSINSFVQNLDHSDTTFNVFSDDGQKIHKYSDIDVETKYFLALCFINKNRDFELSPSIMQIAGEDLLKQYIGYAKWAQDQDDEIKRLGQIHSDLQAEHQKIAMWALSLDKEREELIKKIEALTARLNELNQFNASNYQFATDAGEKWDAKKENQESQLQSYQNLLDIAKVQYDNDILKLKEEFRMEKEKACDHHLKELEEYKNQFIEKLDAANQEIDGLQKELEQARLRYDAQHQMLFHQMHAERLMAFEEINRLHKLLEDISRQSYDQLNDSSQQIQSLHIKFNHEEGLLRNQFIELIQSLQEGQKQICNKYDSAINDISQNIRLQSDEFLRISELIVRAQGIIDLQDNTINELKLKIANIESRRWWFR